MTERVNLESKILRSTPAALFHNDIQAQIEYKKKKKKILTRKVEN